MRRQVVLPDPDGPSSVKNSPSSMSRLMSSTARTSPKSRLTWAKRTAGLLLSVTMKPLGSRDKMRRCQYAIAWSSCHRVILSQLDHDMLGDLVIADRLGRKVFAEAGLLEAAARP